MTGGDTAVHALQKAGSAGKFAKDNSSHKHLEDCLENVETAEWCMDIIVPRMEEHVLAVGA